MSWDFRWSPLGARASVETQAAIRGREYTKYLYLHGLSVETAEALAEFITGTCAKNWASRRRLAAHPRPLSPEVSRLAIFASATPRVRTWKTRPSCLRCSIRKRMSECA